MAIKDSFWTKGVRTTGGTKVLADFVPTEDATAVARLKAAGCVLVGKSSMHEMAYGFTSRNPHTAIATIPGIRPGSRRQQRRQRRRAGDGDGARRRRRRHRRLEPAAGGALRGRRREGHLWTRQPARRHPALAGRWTPSARWPARSATPRRSLQVMAGHDPKDPTTRRGAVPDYLAALSGGLKGIRIGVPHDQFMAMMEPDVGAAIQDALGVLKQGGATFVDVRFPPLDPVVGAHRAIIFCEAAAAHEELIRTRAADFSDEVRPLLQAGLFLTATQYLAAQQARQKTIAAYREIWRSFDVLVTPTSPIAAPPIGATTARLGDKEIPLVRAFLDLTLPFNLTGQPAISVPCGFTQAGLPIGLQLVGRPFDEATLFRAAAAYEAATDWHSRKPPIRGAREKSKWRTAMP